MDCFKNNDITVTVASVVLYIIIYVNIDTVDIPTFLMVYVFTNL